MVVTKIGMRFEDEGLLARMQEMARKATEHVWHSVMDARPRQDHLVAVAPPRVLLDEYDVGDTHRFRCVVVPRLIRPFTIPAWELYRDTPNPPARSLLAWARATKRDTRKGGGWLRRQWRRHAYQAPRDLVGEKLRAVAEQLSEGMAAFVSGCSDMVDALVEAGEAASGYTRGLADAFDAIDFATLRDRLGAAPLPPPGPPVAHTDDPELAAELRRRGVEVRPVPPMPEVPDLGARGFGVDDRPARIEDTE
jgi:hypothetical protein